MTVLEEIKEVATSSANVAQRAVEKMSLDKQRSEEALRVFRDALLDMRADLMDFYQIAVHRASSDRFAARNSCDLARGASC